MYIGKTHISGSIWHFSWERPVYSRLRDGASGFDRSEPKQLLQPHHASDRNGLPRHGKGQRCNRRRKRAYQAITLTLLFCFLSCDLSCGRRERSKDEESPQSTLARI